MARLGRWPTLIAALGIAVSACGDQGTGFIHGDRLEVDGCHGLGSERVWEPFEMGLTFMTAQRDGDMVMLRLASDSGQLHELDQLTVIVEGYVNMRAEIADVGFATRTLTGPLTGVDALSPGAEHVDAGLVLLRSCRVMPSPLRATGGEVTFEHLGATRGERVKGVMRFDLADDREGEVVGVGFVAEFDFEVAISQPHRTFSPTTNR